MHLPQAGVLHGTQVHGSFGSLDLRLGGLESGGSPAGDGAGEGVVGGTSIWKLGTIMKLFENGTGMANNGVCGCDTMSGTLKLPNMDSGWE